MLSHHRILPLLLAPLFPILLLCGPALAQETPGSEPATADDAERLEQALRVVERAAVGDATEEELARARVDLHLAGVRGLRATLERLPGAEPVVRQELEAVFLEGVGLLQAELGQAEEARRGALRRQLADLGPAAALSYARTVVLGVRSIEEWSLDAVGAGLPTAEEAEEVARLFSQLVRDTLARLKNGEDPQLLPYGRLVAPLVAILQRSEEPAVSEELSRIRRQLVSRYMAELQSGDAATRRVAEEALYTLGELARPELGELQAQGGADARYRAERLLHRIEVRMPEQVFAATGLTLEGFEQLPWRERRALVFELEIAAGVAAIPPLRRVLVTDPVPEVKLLAATSLARLGDPFGIRTLEQAGLLDLLPSKDVTIALLMDQGLKYLRVKRYQQAASEFEKILELDAENETAWYNLACAWSLQGELDQAVEALRTAVGHGFTDLAHIEQDPDLDNIREHPGYLEIVEGLRALTGDD